MTPSFLNGLSANLYDELSIIILQMIVIILVANIFEIICRRLWQPAVIGQIFAGIVLGPTVMGLFFPKIFSFLFPPDSLQVLKIFSNIGLILFMCFVGMELGGSLFKTKTRQALVISMMGIFVPFILGTIFAFFIYKPYSFGSVPLLSFSLFIGIAMSITAFPVLARIIQERRLTNTHLGALAITCAAINDLIAWCLLAGILAIASAGSGYAALLTFVLAFAYIVFMFKFLRPALQKHYETHPLKKNSQMSIVAILFLLMLASSYITNLIGIHPLFGAFIAGLIMPSHLVSELKLMEKIESVSLVLFLPIFFVISGLRTQIQFLSTWGDWGVCLLVILVAVAGKFGGCFFAAKLVGEKWKDALSIGVLMNTRGLIELVVLNIGYELGILKPQMFSILVIMALVTTLLTNPLLELINKIYTPAKST